MEYQSHSLEDGLLSMADEGGISSNVADRLDGSAGHRLNSSTNEFGSRQEVEYLSMDNALVKYVGEFGRGQVWHFIMVCSAWVPTSMFKMVMIFADRVPEWRCVATPMNSDAQGEQFLCSLSSSICDMDRGSWEWVGGRSATIVSEWDLICGEEYKTGLVGSLFFTGVLLGGGIWGSFSDSVLGRKGTFTLTLISAVVLGLLTSLAPSFWIYTVLRFMTGVSCSGISQCLFVLATEAVGPTKRGSVGMSVFYFFSLGVVILPVFGYLASSWRELYFATSLFSAVYCILVLPFLNESPRWYLVKGREGDAMKVLRSFAKVNGNVLPEGTRLTVDLDSPTLLAGSRNQHASKEDIAASSEGSTAIAIPDLRLNNSSLSLLLKHGVKCTGTLFDVFRCKETRDRMLRMICVWYSTGLVYYGLSLNVVNLDVNLYLSVFLNGIIEIPALAITAALSSRLGRRVVQIGSMIISGFCCLVGSLLFVSSPGGLGETPSSGPSASLNYYDHAGMLKLLQPGIMVMDTNISSWPSSFQRHHLHLPSATEFGENSSESTVSLMAIMRLLCGVLALSGMSGSYNVLYIYTTELFPTVVRNAVLGTGVQAAGIGAVGGPIIALLGRFFPPLPFAVFGVLAFSAAAIGIHLPETLNQPLWETMEGLEREERRAKRQAIRARSTPATTDSTRAEG